MIYVRERIKIGLLATMFTLVLAVFAFPLASASYLPPNWSFEDGVLCTVPDHWVMKTLNVASPPPPPSPTYLHEVCGNDTHYFSGERSCWLHSRVVDTDGTARARYSWTWIEPENWINQPDATYVRFYIRDIQSTHSLSWGWNNYISLRFNDSLTVKNIWIYRHGQTINFHYYNDTKVGADGATWYEYIYSIPGDIDKSHMKVQIICLAEDWTYYSTSNFADMRFCVDNIDLLYAVGGIWIPVDKLGLLAPYIAFASTIAVATAAAVIYVKRVKRRE